MLIFVLQAIWLYIKELAGKDLDITTVLELLFYITPTLIPLILPLTILLSSIMVFGDFAENYEFAAMKSTGISLQRAMSGLGIFIVLLSIITFFFSNNVIPWAEYETHNLRRNIAKVKPAMAIAEGQFNQLSEDFNIKVAKKTGERGQFLEQISIHQGKTGNHKITIAKTGELVSSDESNILQLVLYDGYSYDDSPPKDRMKRLKRPFTKSAFKKYTMNIDLSQLNAVDLNDKSTTDKYSMLNISDLDYAIDTLAGLNHDMYDVFAKSLFNRTNMSTINLTLNPKKDTIYSGPIIDLYKTRQKVQILDYALNSTSSTKQIITSKASVMKIKTIWLNRHIIALHEKFALAIACIILFFVGAPLGALIRKGGLGLPMVIAIVIFLSYHFIGIFAKNSAKDGSFNPAFATWFSTLIMLPLSIFLTRRATADRGLFEFDHIIEPIKSFFQKNGEGSKNKTAKHAVLSPDISSAASTQGAAPFIFKKFFIIKEMDQSLYIELIQEQIKALDISSIKAYVKKGNPSTYLFQFDDSSSATINTAFVHALKSRMTNPELVLSSEEIEEDLLSKHYKADFSLGSSPGEITTDTVASVKRLKEHQKELLPLIQDYKLLNRITSISYIIAWSLFILHFVFANNKLPQLTTPALHLSAISAFIYALHFIKTLGTYNKIQRLSATLKSASPNIILLSGFVLYPIIYFNRARKMREKFNIK